MLAARCRYWSWRSAYWVAAGLMLLAVAALAIDMPLVDWLSADQPGESVLPGDLRKIVLLAEVFAHASGVVFILLGFYVLDRRRRRAWLRCAACSLGAGLWANVFKLVVGRVRPRDFTWPGNVLETFVGWFPTVWEPGLSGASLQSFPSAHTATAFGLAGALGYLYPHARWYFALLASLAAWQRLEVGAHYLSDVLFGASLGLAWAAYCTGPGGLGRWFDRYETR